MLQARTILVNNNKLSSIARCWLLMSIEFFSNGCKPLSNDVCQFYTKQLGEEAMAYIKKINNELSITASYQNMKLDMVQNYVNQLPAQSNAQTNVNTNTNNWEGGDGSWEEKTVDKSQEKQHKNKSHSFNNEGSQVRYDLLF